MTLQIHRFVLYWFYGFCCVLCVSRSIGFCKSSVLCCATFFSVYLFLFLFFSSVICLFSFHIHSFQRALRTNCARIEIDNSEMNLALRKCSQMSFLSLLWHGCCFTIYQRDMGSFRCRNTLISF